MTSKEERDHVAQIVNSLSGGAPGVALFYGDPGDDEAIIDGYTLGDVTPLEVQVLILAAAGGVLTTFVDRSATAARLEKEIRAFGMSIIQEAKSLDEIKTLMEESSVPQVNSD